MARRLSLGLDSSTQSLTAVLIDIDNGTVVREHSVSYRGDPRLSGWGFDHREMIVPPREPGEADQPPKLFLASLDAIFADLAAAGVPLGEVAVINTSGQQHGHAYLGPDAREAFAGLRNPGAASGGDLVTRLGGVFSYGTAPIWKTANTAPDADAIRQGVGGKRRMIELSGSDSPLRFTGAVIRRVGRQFPALYEKTEKILLISDFVPAVLTGAADVPVDFGNGAGTSLMNYRARTWDRGLIEAASAGLPGGAAALQAKLPEIVHPLTVVGTIASYFSETYGFSPECRIVVGSGDNPQTKVLIDGDLLSLGTSFVIMASGTEDTVDLEGHANSMYDGLGRPFIFGCRTNGALVWDRIKDLYSLDRNDHELSRAALAAVPAGSVMRIWQPDTESFPLSPATPFLRLDGGPKDFRHDYAGVIDSSLAMIWNLSRNISPVKSGRLYLTGGPSKNAEIVRRVAAIWNMPVSVIGGAGAALGTAVAGAAAVTPESERAAVVSSLCGKLLNLKSEVTPEPALVDAYHGKGGYIERLVEALASRAK
jgi:xylulokinase